MSDSESSSSDESDETDFEEQTVANNEGVATFAQPPGPIDLSLKDDPADILRRPDFHHGPMFGEERGEEEYLTAEHVIDSRKQSEGPGLTQVSDVEHISVRLEPINMSVERTLVPSVQLHAPSEAPSLSGRPSSASPKIQTKEEKERAGEQSVQRAGSGAGKAPTHASVGAAAKSTTTVPLPQLHPPAAPKAQTLHPLAPAHTQASASTHTGAPAKNAPSTTTNSVANVSAKTNGDQAASADTATTPSPKRTVKRKRNNFTICLSNCKYDVVHRMSRRFGFREAEDEEDWNLYWTDFSVCLERVMVMKRYQKINHFPGMSEICRKDLLAKNLCRMQKQFPKDYNFFPKSWVLPADYSDLMTFSKQKRNTVFIVKPPASCQGRGIWLTKNVARIKPNEHAVVQTYLKKPFLIDGYKFDLRVYVLVLSCDPLRMFTFRDGLARFATAKYSAEHLGANLENPFMHLTNYAVQKNSSNYIDDEFVGTKRRISTIMRFLSQQGHNVDKLWSEIDECAIKTLIACQCALKHNYRTCFPNSAGSVCFELLGFDIVLDKKLRPYVLEVNHSPSFTTDAQIDLDIKEPLILDTFDVVNLGALDRRKCLEEDRRKMQDRLILRQTKKNTLDEFEKEQVNWLKERSKWEETHCGNYRLIYPIEGSTEKYAHFFQNTASLFVETAAFRARAEAARQLREELIQKEEGVIAGPNFKARSVPGKNDVMRPESPERSNKNKKNAPRRPAPLAAKRFNQLLDPFTNSLICGLNGWNVPNLQHGIQGEGVGPNSDSHSALAIEDGEEMQRLSELVERENLLRSVGVVDFVYRLLQGTPGTSPSLKPPGVHGHGAKGAQGAQTGGQAAGTELQQTQGQGVPMQNAAVPPGGLITLPGGQLINGRFGVPAAGAPVETNPASFRPTHAGVPNPIARYLQSKRQIAGAQPPGESHSSVAYGRHITVHIPLGQIGQLGQAQLALGSRAGPNGMLSGSSTNLQQQSQLQGPAPLGGSSNNLAAINSALQYELPLRGDRFDRFERLAQIGIEHGHGLGLGLALGTSVGVGERTHSRQAAAQGAQGKQPGGTDSAHAREITNAGRITFGALINVPGDQSPLPGGRVLTLPTSSRKVGGGRVSSVNYHSHPNQLSSNENPRQQNTIRTPMFEGRGSRSKQQVREAPELTLVSTGRVGDAPDNEQEHDSGHDSGGERPQRVPIERPSTPPFSLPSHVTHGGSGRAGPVAGGGTGAGSMERHLLNVQGRLGGKHTQAQQGSRTSSAIPPLETYVTGILATRSPYRG